VGPFAQPLECNIKYTADAGRMPGVRSSPYISLWRFKCTQMQHMPMPRQSTIVAVTTMATIDAVDMPDSGAGRHMSSKHSHTGLGRSAVDMYANNARGRRACGTRATYAIHMLGKHLAAASQAASGAGPGA
jgi:hypothetical protein